MLLASRGSFPDAVLSSLVQERHFMLYVTTISGPHRSLGGEGLIGSVVS
jgi:hypothetical protein